MKKAKLTLRLSIGCVAFTLVALLINEGVFSKQFSTGYNPIQVRVWRGNCETFGKPPPNGPLPFVTVHGTDSFLDYFTGAVDGVIRLSFMNGSPSAPATWNFFDDCNSFGVDVSELGGRRIKGADFQFFANSSSTGQGVARPLDPGKAQAEVVELSEGIFLIRNTGDGEIASMEVRVADLLNRTGLAQFGFDTVPWFAFTQRQVSSDETSGTDLLNEPWFYGGNIARLLPLGSGQRTIDQHSGSGMNAIISHIESNVFGNANRLVSIVLSTLLGLFIGAIFESTLVLATLREINEEVVPALKEQTSEERQHSQSTEPDSPSSEETEQEREPDR